MQINVFDQFDATILCTLAMDIIIPNLKTDIPLLNYIHFNVFHIKPRPFCKMRAIAKKINSAQLDHSTKLLTKIDIDPTYSF